MALLPKVKLKAMLNFPSNVIDGTGVDVTRVNGAFKLDLAFDDFAPPVSSLSDPSHQNVLLWNNVTGSYALAAAELIGGPAGPEGPEGPMGPQGPPGEGLMFLQAGTGAVERTSQNKARDIVSVLDFGADPTGVDSTAAMQAAHNTGHLVFYPKGVYVFSTLTIAQGGIIGEGMALTNLMTTSLGSADAITYTGIGGIATASPARFENFLLQTSGIKTAGAGIKFAPSGAGESYYAAVKGVQIVNLPIGIYFVAASNWTVFDCKILLYQYYGILVDNTNNADSGDSSITNCLINTASSTGVAIRQLSSGGLKIIGNKLLGGSIGYELAFYNDTSTGDLMITGNSIEQMLNQSIKLARASGSAIFGQITITGNQFALGVMHIAAQAHIYDLTISGNVFAVTSGGVGVYLDSVDNFVVSGNTMRGGAANTGVFYSSCANGLIIGNQIIGFTTNVTAASGTVYTYNNPT